VPCKIHYIPFNLELGSLLLLLSLPACNLSDTFQSNAPIKEERDGSVEKDSTHDSTKDSDPEKTATNLCSPSCVDPMFCDQNLRKCIACFDDPDCESGYCVDGACVECADDLQCEPERSSCSNNICQPCTTDTHCAHFPSTKVCTKGKCVQCTQDSDCPMGLCSFEKNTKNTCVSGLAKSKTHCQSCLSDSQCQDGYRCTPMQYPENIFHGNYCLEIAPTTATADCLAPYRFTLNRPSLNGQPAVRVCAVRPITTCEAVLSVQINPFCGTQSGGRGDKNATLCNPADTMPTRAIL